MIIPVVVNHLRRPAIPGAQPHTAHPRTRRVTDSPGTIRDSKGI